jgi:hypothetical protein
MKREPPTFTRAGRGERALSQALIDAPTDTVRGAAVWEEALRKSEPGDLDGLRTLRVAIEYGRIERDLARVYLCVEPWPTIEEVKRWLDGSKSSTAEIRRAGLQVVRGGGVLKHRLRDTADASSGQELSQATLQRADDISPSERARLMEYAATTAPPKARALLKAMQELEACGSGPLPDSLFLRLPHRDPS